MVTSFEFSALLTHICYSVNSADTDLLVSEGEISGRGRQLGLHSFRLHNS